MNALDILKKHDDTSCILLYGNTSDLVLSKDLCFREFRVALADILHETGYDNVVFMILQTHLENLYMMMHQLTILV